MERAAPPTSLLACTEVQTHPFVPEIRLHLAKDAFDLWEATGSAMGQRDVPPPFWATAWPGGLGLARHLLDHPEIVLGRTVVDVATGSGVVAIAAALAGARSVAACDTDALAVHAATMNADLNQVGVAVSMADVREVSAARGALVTAGDVFYDRDIAAAMLEGLSALAEAGAEILVGDPFRSYLPEDRLEPLANFDIDVDMFIESDRIKPTVVARLR